MTAPFCGAADVGTTTAPAGRCTGCASGIVGSCTPYVVVAGTPVFFVRALMNFTSPTLPCPVACNPTAAMVKPGFTGASPPNSGPMIRVVAAFRTHSSNNVPLALASPSIVFGVWASFFFNSGGPNPLPPPSPTAASSCVTFLHS